MKFQDVVPIDRRRGRPAMLLVAVMAMVLLALPGSTIAQSTDHTASGFLFVKPIDQVICQEFYSGGFLATYFTRGECLRLDFNVTNTSPDSPPVRVNLIGPDGGAPFATFEAFRRSGDNAWRVVFQLAAGWPAGKITTQVVVDGDSAPAGESVFYLNALGANVAAVAKPDGSRYAPGEAIPLTGNVYELTDIVGGTQKTGVPATFSLQARAPDGTLLGTYGPFTANGDGSFPAITLPAEATAALQGGPDTEFKVVVAVDVLDARYTDLITGAWASKHAGSGAVTLLSRPDTLLLENSYVSSVGWVKPGESYPFRVLVKNMTDQDATNVAVTIPAPDGVTFNKVTTLANSGSATTDGSSITWSIPTLAAPGAADATIATLVVEAAADSLEADPEIVWKDLSTTATMTYDGLAAPMTASSHGPKVIPPAGGFETARYGDKPFPIVPVDFRDRKHEAGHSGDVLARVVNSPDVPGSTYNLYQEMSYGQLHPFGAVPSAGIATAGFDYAPGFSFTSTEPTKVATCRGTTLGPAPLTFGTPVYPERIRDGWYQLPGDTEYYGGDYPAFTLGVAGSIDSACGNISKSVYDAASIADPEIDYNRFDSDKDGVVDFFMMVFVGLGGNGASQIQGTPPYDNIWPHSSSLEFSYQDENGLSGYISDDQLTDLEGNPQCWTSTAYETFDDCASAGGTGLDELPTYVRVGPYNVNPEDAIEHASVISHEYGHHLGLPDFYASYSAYNDWNLMAADYSQHMTIFSKQELGWVVPRFLQPGEEVNLTDWEEIKNDTGQITWQRPDGSFYTLSAANGDQNIHNGEAYALKLPPRLLIDPEKVATQASAPYVWYSGRGNDFGCPPKAGHNLDIALPELESVPAGTNVTLTFKSSWDIEWDWDFGFTMVTTDGSNYTALPSQKGYTSDNAFNPYNVNCFATFNNGLTGQSGTYAAGLQAAERLAPDYNDGSPFLTDQYDLSAYAGQSGVVLRFSYFTDPAFDRPGWFIDDIEIRAGDQVIYASDFSEEEPLRIFPGGCGDEGMKVAATCTAGWSRIKADAGSDLDHAYYLELRDRSGFDFNGRGQSDRGDIGWAPGVLIEYTDEARGYGNNGGSQPPNQHYIDSQPEPGLDCGDNLVEEHPPAVLTDPRCQDAAFTADAGDNHFADVGWIDNFHDESSEDGYWHFDHNCLTLDVLSMAGHTAHSEALPSDLTAAATIRAGAGCAPFTYGNTGSGTTSAPDLVVTDITTISNTGDGAKNAKPKEGDKVTIVATIANQGTAHAGASTTEFLLDGTTILGLVATGAIPPGGSTTVSVEWDTRGVKGEHVIQVIADRDHAVAESSETNNAATLTVTVRGNKVQNGSFEQADSDGSAPANWTASDTDAGSTSWSEGGSDGSRSASATGNGGSTLLAGSPNWTSDPIPVTAGETLTLRVSVNAAEATSAPSAGLAYLGAAGELRDTVTLITAPLATDGFATLEQVVTIPTGVAQVRVVLNGFAPTDTATGGTVTFDDIGLYGE